MFSGSVGTNDLVLGSGTVRTRVGFQHYPEKNELISNCIGFLPNFLLFHIIFMANQPIWGLEVFHETKKPKPGILKILDQSLLLLSPCVENLERPIDKNIGSSSSH